MATRHEQDGAVAIVTALMLVVLLLLAAFLVDLGWTRADARADQLLADSSVMAAALTEDTPAEQCEAAVDYYAVNISAAATGSPDCAAVFPTSWECENPATWPFNPPTAIYVVGEFTMEITIPVPDTDPAMTVGGQQITGDDGDPCSRVKVSVHRTRDYVFGGVAGGTNAGASINDAVALRFTPPEPEIFPSLIVLEEKACDVLSAGGGGSEGEVHIEDGQLWDPDGAGPLGAVRPKGIITVDTTADGAPESYEDGSSCGVKRAIVVNGGACIAASGDIFSFGIAEGNEGNVYSTGDLDPDACQDLDSPERGLWPQPQSGDPGGRKQVDWRFNCQDPYPTVADPSAGGENMRYPAAAHASPDRHDPCPEAGERPAFIDALHLALDDGPDASLGFVTTGGGNCSADIRYDDTTRTLEFSEDGGATWTPYGTSSPPDHRVRIECSVGSNDTLDLQGVDYVFFDNPISAPTAALTIRGPSATEALEATDERTGAVVYFPDSGIESIGDVELLDVFVYVDNGHVAAGDNDELTWHGMVLSDEEARNGIDGGCSAYVASATPANLPPPGCFAPLALWSNGVQKNRAHGLGGGGDLSVAGTFFTPNAEQELSGGGSSDFKGSQFYANILRAVGGAKLIMQPSPNSNIPEEPPDPGLIR